MGGGAPRVPGHAIILRNGLQGEDAVGPWQSVAGEGDTVAVRATIAGDGGYRRRWGFVPLQVLKNRPTCDGKPVQNTKNVAGQPEGRFFVATKLLWLCEL